MGNVAEAINHDLAVLRDEIEVLKNKNLRKGVKNMNVATIRSMIWRLVRVSVATAISQTFLLQPDWSNPQQATKTVAISFVSGFLVALSMGIRDTWGNDNKAVGVINKLPL